MRPRFPRIVPVSLLGFAVGVTVGLLYASTVENRKIRQVDLALSLAVADAESSLHRRKAELCDLVLLNCQANYVRVIRGLEALETKCGAK